MKKPLKYLFTLAVPLAIAGAFAMRVLPFGDNAADAYVYETAPAAKGEIKKIVSTSGPVRALVTVSVGSQLSGQIDTLAVDYNSEVKAGDVLAAIDARTFEAKVAQAKADLAAAKASLLNQQAVVQKSEAVLENAKRTVERQKRLESKGYAATATLDNAERDQATAKADLEVAKAQIDNAKAVIAQREAALNSAQVDLERTRIVSPINGTVISRSIDLGQTVAASFQAPELFKIAQDLRLISIEAQVNEADVGSVSEGNPVAFNVDAYPDRTFEGKVTQVRLSSTELQNIVTYTVIVEAENKDRKLFPGMTANVQITVAEKDGVLRVPNDAIRFRPRGESANTRQGSGRGGERQLSRLKNTLNLTSEQEEAVRAAVKQLFSDSSGGFGGRPSRRGMHQKIQAVIENTLTPMISDEQRTLFENWKRGRENVKRGTVYVLDPATKTPERRSVRLGIADDQHVEIAGGQLAEGELVVVRARRAKQ